MTTSKKTTKFVIELEGVELPEKIQTEISKDLSSLFMEKIAGLDLLNKDSNKKNGVTFGIIDLINGRRLRLLEGAINSKVFELIGGNNFNVERENITGYGVNVNARV